MHGIWKIWMTAWCAIAIVLGLELAGAAFPATDFGARAYFALVSGFSWDPAVFDPPGMRFAVGVLGAILMGWGLTVLGLVRSPGVPRPVWTAVTVSVGIWFVVDSVLSVATGFPLNAVMNGVFLAGYLVPVAASGILRQSKGGVIASQT